MTKADYSSLSGILQTARNNALPVATIVRAFEAGSGAYLQVDPDGAANGQNWVTIARLEGVRAGNTVNVNLATWEIGGPAITVLRPTAGDFGRRARRARTWRRRQANKTQRGVAKNQTGIRAAGNGLSRRPGAA